MRPNSRAHDPFAPHRGSTGPAPSSTRPARRRGGRRKRSQAQPEQAAPQRTVEPVEIERGSLPEVDPVEDGGGRGE